jgi:hypothetical protein
MQHHRCRSRAPSGLRGPAAGRASEPLGVGPAASLILVQGGSMPSCPGPCRMRSHPRHTTRSQSWTKQARCNQVNGTRMRAAGQSVAPRYDTLRRHCSDVQCSRGACVHQGTCVHQGGVRASGRACIRGCACIRGRACMRGRVFIRGTSVHQGDVRAWRCCSSNLAPDSPGSRRAGARRASPQAASGNTRHRAQSRARAGELPASGMREGGGRACPLKTPTASSIATLTPLLVLQVQEHVS